MGLFDFFKRKGKDIGFVIYIKDKIPYSQRREIIGEHIKSIISRFYRQVAIQYYSDEKKKYITSLNVVGADALFKENSNEEVITNLIHEIVSFFLRNKLKCNSDTIEPYNPKPFEEEVMGWALDTTKEWDSRKRDKKK